MTENTENKTKINITEYFKGIIGGKLLASNTMTKQLPFIFLIAAMFLGLIFKRYMVEDTLRNIGLEKDTLKELKTESVIHETKLMYINRPSEVNRKIIEREIDLIEAPEPARRITVKKLEKK